jgi:hypothetical protein
MAAALTQALHWMDKVQKASFCIPEAGAPAGSEAPAVTSSKNASDGNASETQPSPWLLIEKYLSQMNDDIKKILATSHPILENVANYYFELKARFIPV